MIKALTRPIVDYRTKSAGAHDAATNTYNPEGFLQATMPRITPWDPNNNPRHKQLQIIIDHQEETTITTQATPLRAQTAASGSPIFQMLLLGLLLAAEFASSISLVRELGIEGFAVIPISATLAGTLFFFVQELRHEN